MRLTITPPLRVHIFVDENPCTGNPTTGSMSLDATMQKWSVQLIILAASALWAMCRITWAVTCGGGICPSEIQ